MRYKGRVLLPTDEGNASPHVGVVTVLLRRAVAAIRAGGEPLAAGASWGACSIGMTLLNKRAIDKTGAPLGVVVLQMLATVLVAISQFRRLHFGRGTRLWASTVPVLFMCMMGSSMLALQYVSVGAFVIVRNLGPLVTLVMEVSLHKPDNLSCNARTAGATLAIAVGVWMYEANDMRWSQKGFFFLLANLGFACAERMLQRHLLHVSEVDVSRTALMLLNNGIGAALTVLAVSLGKPREWHALYRALRHVRGAASYTLASCVVGCAISYTGLWLQSLITATSFMVLGSITKMAVIAWGMVFLHDAAGPLAVGGALISMAGGLAYARKGDCGPRAEAGCVPAMPLKCAIAG